METPSRSSLTIRSALHALMKHGWMVVLLVMLGLNVHLLRERRAVSAPQPPALEVGAILPSVDLVRARTNQRVRLDFERSSRPTVIYAFSPTCSWCWRNEPNLLALRKCVDSQYEFVAVTSVTAGLSEYFESKPPTYPVLVDDTGNFRTNAKIRTTPTLILIEAGGRVAGVWGGAWRAEKAKQVEEQFRCELPGLRQLPQG